MSSLIPGSVSLTQGLCLSDAEHTSSPPRPILPPTHARQPTAQVETERRRRHCICRGCGGTLPQGGRCSVTVVTNKNPGAQLMSAQALRRPQPPTSPRSRPRTNATRRLARAWGHLAGAGSDSRGGGCGQRRARRRWVDVRRGRCERGAVRTAILTSSFRHRLCVCDVWGLHPSRPLFNSPSPTPPYHRRAFWPSPPSPPPSYSFTGATDAPCFSTLQAAPLPADGAPCCTSARTSASSKRTGAWRLLAFDALAADRVGSSAYMR